MAKKIRKKNAIDKSHKSKLKPKSIRRSPRSKKPKDIIEEKFPELVSPKKGLFSNFTKWAASYSKFLDTILIQLLVAIAMSIVLGLIGWKIISSILV